MHMLSRNQSFLSISQKQKHNLDNYGKPLMQHLFHGIYNRAYHRNHCILLHEHISGYYLLCYYFILFEVLFKRTSNFFIKCMGCLKLDLILIDFSLMIVAFI